MAHHKKKTIVRKTTKEKLLEKKKERKLKLKEKRARLVIKNLPFKATEQNLKEHFEKYGEVSNVQLLKKPDGKLVGCGFIQFNLVQKAAKAKFHTNGKEFLGRDIQVDFALPKNKYKDKSTIKNDEDNQEAEANQAKSSEPIEIIDEIEDEKEESQEKHSDTEDEQSDTDNDDESNDEVDTSDVGDLDEEDNNTEPTQEARKPFKSNDVTEGKTIFIKNIPFGATNDDLKQCMLQFGPLYYALICIDKYTEHSKGTGFVKFRNKEDAEKALNAGTELTLLGNVLDCHLALNKDEVTERNNKKTDIKDSRNLYLVKEGVILAGTKAAESVSASDMAKRLQIEQYKTQMLRNLNMFISRVRLVVHNLPQNWDDKKFRLLVQKYGGKDAVVKEARVMRDMRNVDANGVGKSKEFGFVTFTKHEDAIQCLRTLNNNPNIFTPHKRPIVTFSIENKNILKIRQKRLEKSRLKNPLSKNYDSACVDKERECKKHEAEDSNKDFEEFTGVTAKPGSKKMRSKFNLKTQAKLHYENLKREKKKRKMAKPTFDDKKKEFRKQPKQKINKKQEKDNFSKLVNEYKNKLTRAPDKIKRSKWFE